MSLEEQVTNFCKFYSFYEEIPQEFLDETDVDSLFLPQHVWFFPVPASNSAS